ncbi:hypothetical protein AM593_08324, partial [Mytilus galloprovincialis]
LNVFTKDLTISVVKDTVKSALYLDLHLDIENEGRLKTKLNDKRDDFSFPIMNFPFLCSNIAYGEYTNQLIRYTRFYISDISMGRIEQPHKQQTHSPFRWYGCLPPSWITSYHLNITYLGMATNCYDILLNKILISVITAEALKNESLDKGLFFNVTITERRLNVIRLQVRVSSTKGENFTALKWLYKTYYSSIITEVKLVRGHHIDEFIKVKRLEIGFCYNFQINVQTQNGRWIGPIDQRACTKPRSPGSGTRIGITTITSIPLLIQYPYGGHFDSFRIDYENNANKFSMTVSRAVGVNQTEIEITGLVPQSCYNIDNQVIILVLLPMCVLRHRWIPTPTQSYMVNHHLQSSGTRVPCSNQ